MSNNLSLVEIINNLRNEKKIGKLGDAVMLRAFAMGDMYHLKQEEVLAKIRDYEFQISLHSHATREGGRYFLRFYPAKGNFSLIEGSEIEADSMWFTSTNSPTLMNKEIQRDAKVLNELGFKLKYFGLDQSDWN
jgi:hypothetical protein